LRSLPTPLAQETPNPTLVDVIQGTLFTIQRHLTAQELRASPPDVLIQPAVSRVGLLDFHRASQVIALGEEAAKPALEATRALLKGKEPRLDRSQS
jgi:NTE family protein